MFTNLATLQPHPALVPFGVNSALWSDAAVKSRWVAGPNDGPPYAPTERVGFSAAGVWTFPIGTVTVKHFELVVNEVSGAKKRLETRIGVLLANGSFTGASYRWRADGSDADLVTAATNETNTVTTANGTRTRVHTYPSPAQCVQCHTGNVTLGIRTWQLNGSLTYPNGFTDNQLRAWGKAEMFSGPFDEGSIPTYLRAVAITDTTASLEARARSYFDANCSDCHRPGRNLAWDARFSTPLAQQRIVGKVVVAGDPAGSALHRRMSYSRIDTPTTAGQMMPPLAKNHTDTAALAVIGQWITSLP